MAYNIVWEAVTWFNPGMFWRNSVETNFRLFFEKFRQLLWDFHRYGFTVHEILVGFDEVFPDGCPSLELEAVSADSDYRSAFEVYMDVYSQYGMMPINLFFTFRYDDGVEERLKRLSELHGFMDIVQTDYDPTSINSNCSVIPVSCYSSLVNSRYITEEVKGRMRPCWSPDDSADKPCARRFIQGFRLVP